MSQPQIAIAAHWSRALRHITDGLGADITPKDVSELRAALTQLAWTEGCPRAASFFHASQTPRYRRQLIAAAPDGAYTMLLIAWPPGYVTPLHDHAELWGIELVLDGALQVEEYFSDGDSQQPALQPHRSLMLGSGDAAVFIDPAYVHRCRNLSAQRPALSLHVYGGVLDHYRSFVEVSDNLYRIAQQQAVLDAVSI
ncbi:MAG: cysteine dioxygenase family protein [Rudaea sp.]|uniref:cysteine dioxygenase n=1 Tax=Rudaea sp. TaxID=2136325 RepID=UPI0039E4D57A